MTNSTLDGSGSPFLISADTTQQANDGDELLLLGTINNAGTVLLNGTGGPFHSQPTLGDFALAILSSPTVTLTGTGTVELVGGDPANIYGSGATLQTLVNDGNTIVGEGGIGGEAFAVDADDTLEPINLINGTGGVIDANGTIATVMTQTTFEPGQVLFVANGGSVLVNSGLIEATGVGGMILVSDTIDQSGGGTILATGAGVTVTVGGADNGPDVPPFDLIGGTLDAIDGGSINFASFSGVALDGRGSPLTIGIGSDIEINLSDAAIELFGTIVNLGTFGGANPIALYTAAAAMTGGGDLLDPYIFGHGGTLAAFTNENTVTGTGQIGVFNFIYTAPVIDNGVQQFGSAPIALTNLAGGVIDATGTLQSGNEDAGRGATAGILLYNGGATSINNGLLEATGIEGLDIIGGTLDQSGGGTLLASGAAVGVYLQSIDVIGGAIVSDNGGSIDFQDGSSTITATGGSLALGASTVLETSNLLTTGTLTLQASAIANAGTIIDAGTMLLASPTVSLSGGGLVKISGVLNTSGTGVLINNNNTITGAGDISSATLALTNSAAGEINGLSLDVGGKIKNAGLLENVTVGAGIVTTIDNTGTGELLASGTGAIVGLYNADIVGGTLAAAGGGIFQLIALSQAQAPVTLDGRGVPVTIAAGTTLEDFANTNADSGLVLLGSIDLLGTIDGFLDIHSTPFAIPNSGVLSGSGTVSGYLANTGTLLAQGGTLAVSNDVDGSGRIVIDAGAAFALGGESGETIDFGGRINDRVVLDTPSAYSGTLANLTYGDIVDLGTNDIKSAVIVNTNTLAVTLIQDATTDTTVDLALDGLHAGTSFVPRSTATPTETYDFTYVGTGTSLEPNYSAHGSGSFTLLTGGGTASLGDVTGFTLSLSVTNSGSDFPGTDQIVYDTLTNFAATFGPGNALAALSFATNTGDDIGQGHVIQEQFEVSGLAAAGATTDNSSVGATTKGSITVTPLGPTLSELFVACFAKGTLIATPNGPRAVENLSAGGTVLTASGEMRDIVWIGHRRIDARRHPKPARVWPVRIAAGAFAPDCPCNDLFLSPDHAVFVDEVLIPIKHLINGTSIAQFPVDEIVYYHIELASHDVLLAEAMPVESWLDTADRSRFDNGGPVVALNPDFSSCMWEASGCAPLIVVGPLRDAVRDRVNARAAAPLPFARGRAKVGV